MHDEKKWGWVKGSNQMHLEVGQPVPSVRQRSNSWRPGKEQTHAHPMCQHTAQHIALSWLHVHR